MDVEWAVLCRFVGVKLTTLVNYIVQESLVWHTENKETKYSPKNVIKASKMPFTFHCFDNGADRESPPSVLPGVLNTSPVAGPPSLTAFLIAAVRAGGLAPLIVSMQVPLWKILKVGMAETLWARAIPDWLSTLTLAKATFFGAECSLARASKVGAIALQGPHQSA